MRSDLWLTSVGVLLLASGASAQTDYYNTDAGRPVVIEDAYATERYALELQVAPLRVERLGAGLYNWEIEPELAYGVLPRTHIELGFPLAYLDAPGGAGTSGLAGIDVSLLHNLNIETRLLPALGIAAEAVLPVGNLGPARVYPSLKGVATRTFRWARFHVNGGYTFGPEPAAAESAEDVSRWRAGVAVDRVFPLRSLLVIGEVYAEQPLASGEDLEWNTGVGARWQWSPRLALDAGLGRQVTGEPRWYVTFGAAYHFAIRGLIPVSL